MYLYIREHFLKSVAQWRVQRRQMYTILKKENMAATKHYFYSQKICR